MPHHRTFPALLAALLLLGPAARAGLWTDDYEGALKQAKAESRFVLLDFTGSDWCGWCKRLDAEVFAKGPFKEYAKKNLVCVTVDFPRGFSLPGKVVKQNEALKQAHRITGYPTLILLDPDGNAIGRTGYKAGGADPYVAHLEEIIAPHREKFGAPKAAGPATAAAPGGDFRTWTSTKGATVEARMEQRVGQSVHLRTRAGKLVVIDVPSLSADDQSFLKAPTANP